MRKNFTLFLFIMVGTMTGQVFAGEDLLPARNLGVTSTYVVNPGAYGQADRPAVYNLKKWNVEAEADPVKHALNVYKRKSAAAYNQRIWITNKSNGTQRVLIENIAPNATDKILFSPNEDFMYYLGVAPGGASLVYGVNLLTQQKFSLGGGQNFNAVNCPGKQSFVVIQGQQPTVYQVFTSTGERMKDLTDVNSPVDLEKNLCR